MIGCGIPFPCRLLRICWKFSTIASENPPRSLLPRSRLCLACQIPDLLWRTLSWIVRSTMPINFLTRRFSKKVTGSPHPVTHLSHPHEYIVQLSGESDCFRIHEDLFWNFLWNCAGARKIPGGLWKSGQNSTAHFPTATTTTSLRTRAALFGAPVISILNGNSYYSRPGHPLIPKENYQDSAPCRTPKVQYI